MSSGMSASGSAVGGTVAERMGSTVLTHEFTRSANGVDIRGYEVPSPRLPGGFAQCSIVTGPRFQAEVSTARAVGTVMSGFGPAPSTGAVTSMSSDVIGLAEGDSIGVVVASTSSSVASVKVSFVGGATDQMAPSGGWVALAGPVPANTSKGSTTVRPQVGTLTTYDRAGKQLSTQSVSIGFLQSGGVESQPAFCGTCGGPVLHPVPPPTAGGSPGVVNPGGPVTQSPPNRSSSASGQIACPMQTQTGTGSASGGAANG